MTPNYDHAKLQNHLQTKWKNFGCPMCSAQDWGLSPVAMEMREYQKGNLPMSGQMQVVIPMHCKNCAYTVLINGAIAGVIEYPEA